jgi:exopolysaccharide production protein ExoQ
LTLSRRTINLLSDAYVVCVLVLSTGAFYTLFVDTEDLAVSSQGSPIFTIVWGLIYTISLLRILARRHEAIKLFQTNKTIVLLAGLAVASCYWSIDRSATLHAAAGLILTAIVALDFSIHYSVRQQLRFVCIAFAIVAVLSVVVEVVLPGIVPGQEMEGPAWHGVFGYKNVFGKVICFGTLACVSMIDRSRLLRWFAIVCGLALTVLSRSTSAVGFLAFMLLIFALWPVFKWRPTPRRFALAALTLIAVTSIYVIAQNFARLTTMLDKDPHLTGRVDLWQLALGDIEAQPVLGYGYQAFWSYNSVPARRIREAVNWDKAPHSHNGYIEMTLSLGVTGLIIYGILCWTLIRRGYLFFMHGSENYRRWPLMLLVFTLAYQCTEGTAVGGGIFWMVFCALLFSLTAVKHEATVPQLSRSHSVMHSQAMSADAI